VVYDGLVLNMLRNWCFHVLPRINNRLLNAKIYRNRLHLHSILPSLLIRSIDRRFNSNIMGVKEIMLNQNGLSYKTLSLPKTMRGTSRGPTGT